MTPEHKIAYHHLGDMLRRVDRQGSRYQVVCDDGAIDHPPTAATGSTAAEAAADCASKLRAAGWVPTHPRLEWTREFDDFALVFHFDALPVKLWSGKVYSNGTGWAFNDSTGSLYNGSPLPKAEIVSIIAEWCAANLPSLYLPPFPETPDAS